ncbi:MAG: J domain-containing protein [Myxococcales bacterium]|nr:J domain-containing protein [Myxococcales bacterium]
MTERDADDARLDRLDYYALLGLKPGATHDEIRVAFRRFATRYHPDLYLGSSEEKVARATKIYQRGTEAYRVLLDVQSRQHYDAQLSTGKLRYEPTALTSAEIVRRSIPPAAMPAARAAQQAIKAGDLVRARALLCDALAHDPNNALLRSGLEDVERQLKG